MDEDPSKDRDDLDRRFREIVAGLDREVPEPQPEHRPEARPESHPGPSHLGARTPEGMATDHRSYEVPDEDEHFVPPRPAPLPAGDLHFWAILGCLVLGPALLFLSAVLPVLGSTWAAVGAVLMVAGFVLLVLRQPRHRRHDGDWGARV